MFKAVYEMGTPLLLRALMQLGSVCRPSKSRGEVKTATIYDIADLAAVARPSEGEYLHTQLTYRRIFIYENLNQKKKTGLVGLFIMDGGSGDRAQPVGDTLVDLSRPQVSPNSSFSMNSTCHFWVVKPGGKNVQKNVTVKQCEGMFRQLLVQLQDLASVDGDDGETPNKSYGFENYITLKL